MIVKRGKGDFSQAYRPCRISEVVSYLDFLSEIQNKIESET